MNQSFDFFKTSMPDTRPADYSLGCLNGSIFLDFNLTEDNCIALRRISFDGYGCCELKNLANKLNPTDSDKFITTYKKNNLDQKIMTQLIIKAIKINKEQIWIDALEKYSMLES